jgi:hypothetical protein
MQRKKAAKKNQIALTFLTICYVEHIGEGILMMHALKPPVCCSAS